MPETGRAAGRKRRAGASCLYEGRVRHRRYGKVPHEMSYRLYMAYLDLEERPSPLAGRWLWSDRRPAVVRFRREDHLGPAARPLAQAARDLVAERTGRRPDGPVRLLTQLRHFGYVFNPISLYYCFEPDGETLGALVAEVSNTPWNERHWYVIDASGDGATGGTLTARTQKDFHVSPFLPMEIAYDWRVGLPGESLAVHMDCLRTVTDSTASPPTVSKADSKVMDATLTLNRTPITGSALARVLMTYPLMSFKTIAGIHWEALKLWRKGARVHFHPKWRNREAPPDESLSDPSHRDGSIPG